ncbi:MAG: biotin-dependent carboxyltransferase family protein [Ilumatobacteraceae bacterium]
MTELVVVEAGWATSVQDGGRRSHADIGVPASGALDGDLRDLLNRLVGNHPEAAVLETLGRLRVRATSAAVVATSAERAARAVIAGEIVEVEPAAGDLWGYLAVRGGIAVDPVLGSRSRDSRSGLGPAVPGAGDRLPVGVDPGTPLVVDQAPPPLRADLAGVWPGPRVEWFAPGALEALAATAWTVSADVNRVGARLDGPPLERRITEELPSEGLLLGAVQVPADGRPVVMLADHPTTGGYPVLAVVDRRALSTIVQARPGTSLRFHVLH